MQNKNYISDNGNKSYYKEEKITNTYEPAKLKNISTTSTAHTMQNINRSNSMYTNQPINIYTDKEINIYDNNNNKINYKKYSEYY